MIKVAKIKRVYNPQYKWMDEAITKFSKGKKILHIERHRTKYGYEIANIVWEVV